MLAALLELAPGRGRAGRRRRLRRVRALRRARRAAGASRGRGGGRRRARERARRARWPTTGPSAGSASTCRCWSAGGSACARRGSRRRPRRASIELVIDPGQAFGTGAHPTTRLCLELMLDLEPRGLVRRPRLRLRRAGDRGRASSASGRSRAVDAEPAARRRHARERARERRARWTRSSALDLRERAGRPRPTRSPRT